MAACHEAVTCNFAYSADKRPSKHKIGGSRCAPASQKSQQNHHPETSWTPWDTDQLCSSRRSVRRTRCRRQVSVARSPWDTWDKRFMSGSHPQALFPDGIAPKGPEAKSHGTADRRFPSLARWTIGTLALQHVVIWLASSPPGLARQLLNVSRVSR